MVLALNVLKIDLKEEKKMKTNGTKKEWMVLGIIFLMTSQTTLVLERFTPLEIMPRCSSAGFNAPLKFLTGFTFQKLPFLRKRPND
ncbi:MAG: hypothetical protein A2V86_06080 [Deltaproteobacteria bacterium RBG_16_49_23]|nr:MAG: hypothetical protein A2V86_06080 [Deltaproteobacteria bacterium RBG_16_49_23]